MLVTSRRLRVGAAKIATLSLVAGALLIGAAPAQAAAETQAETGATVTVSQTTVSAEGETEVTVTGAGFDPEAATGVRPPFLGKPGGAYVVFGKFAEQWRPSEDAPTSARVIAEQKWAVPADQMAMLGDAAVELTPEGTFTATLSISKAAVDALETPEDGRYGIYTYAGSGAVSADYETFTPITFASAECVDAEAAVTEAEGVLAKAQAKLKKAKKAVKKAKAKVKSVKGKAKKAKAKKAVKKAKQARKAAKKKVKNAQSTLDAAVSAAAEVC